MSFDDLSDVPLGLLYGTYTYDVPYPPISGKIRITAIPWMTVAPLPFFADCGIPFCKVIQFKSSMSVIRLRDSVRRN